MKKHTAPHADDTAEDYPGQHITGPETEPTAAAPLPNLLRYADDMATEARAQMPTATILDARDRYNAVAAFIHAQTTGSYPTPLGMIASVKYAERFDRYTVTVAHGTVRVSDAVATFLLTHAFGDTRPLVHAHMVDGVVDAVLLLFVTRDAGGR